MRKKELTSRNGGFKVPEGYFDSLEDRILQRVSQEAKPVWNLKTKQPFAVPEGYFDSLEERIMSTVEGEIASPKLVSPSVQRTLSYLSGVAAVLAVILTSVFLNPSQESGFDDLDLVTVETYLLETFESTEPQESLLTEEEFDFQLVEQPLNDEAVLQYITENVEEPSDLLNNY